MTPSTSCHKLDPSDDEGDIEIIDTPHQQIGCTASGVSTPGAAPETQKEEDLITFQGIDCYQLPYLLTKTYEGALRARISVKPGDKIRIRSHNSSLPGFPSHPSSPNPLSSPGPPAPQSSPSPLSSLVIQNGAALMISNLEHRTPATFRNDWGSSQFVTIDPKKRAPGTWLKFEALVTSGYIDRPQYLSGELAFMDSFHPCGQPLPDVNLGIAVALRDGLLSQLKAQLLIVETQNWGVYCVRVYHRPEELFDIMHKDAIGKRSTEFVCALAPHENAAEYERLEGHNREEIVFKSKPYVMWF